MHHPTAGAKVKSERIGPGFSFKKAQLCANDRELGSKFKPSISNPKLKRFGPQTQKTCSKTDQGEGQAQKHRQAIEDYQTTPRIQSGKRIIIYSSEGWRKFPNKATITSTLNTLHQPVMPYL